MITISILGLDQFVVGTYSKENTANLANLYEVDDSQIVFYAPHSMVFHNGVDQTSWNALVVVRAPLKVKVLEAQVAKYILKTLNKFSVHVQINFEYFEQDSFYESINSAYPRFIADSESQEEDYHECECDSEDCNCGEEHDHEHCHCHDKEDSEDIYLGNAFEGFEEKLAEAQKKKN